MFDKHGVLAGHDLTRLRAPLREPLTAVADLERHMDKFLLAAEKLTLAGQGKQPYEYFEASLATVQAFLVVAGSMSTYYAIHPTVDVQTIETFVPQGATSVYVADCGRITVFWCRDTCSSHLQNHQEGTERKTSGMDTVWTTTRTTTPRQFCGRRTGTPCGAMGSAISRRRDTTAQCTLACAIQCQ
jgi:hypothetical protein